MDARNSRSSRMKSGISLFGLPLCIVILFAPVPLATAATIEQSTVTQVVKDVNIFEAQTKRQKTAKTNDLFKIPDVMRTGSDSRAEMIAPDQTITRVGANTVFSFEPEKREVNLQRGSLPFTSPAR